MTELPLPEEAIFLQALEIEATAERMAFLDRACAADARLRAVVDALLRASAKSGDLLDISDRPDAPPTVGQSSAERTGTQIGPYKILQQIGEGGMGTVFMAEQTEPVERRVALKIIKPGMDSRQVIARFAAEKQALALMDHVNIARVLDAGVTEQSRPFFVMELVHGVSITKYCDDNHLTPRQRLELFVPVCQAIQHAHQKGIIHRDIKPSNVMITLYDGKPVPKVIDFGVAKAMDQKLTGQTLFTHYGTMVGTLEYMSPEQAEMSALGVDTRSDIYSLGVLLYELLTGSTPLSRQQMKEAAYGEILRLIRDVEPPKPSTRLSESGESLASISAQRQTEPAKLSKLMRGELDWIVMKTLEKDRNRRYETAKDFAQDVQRYLDDEPVQACPPSAGYRVRKFLRRNKGPVTAASVIVLLLLGGIIGTSWQAWRAIQAQRLAKDNEQQAMTQKAQAQANFELAKDAVDKYLQRITNHPKLNEKDFFQLRKELLETALPFYQKFVEERSDDPELEAARGRVYLQLGGVRTAMGEIEAAQANYEEMRTIFTKLVADFPSTPSYRQELAASHNNLGILHRELGKRAEAVVAYRTALKLYEQLAADFPSVPAYQGELATTHDNLGIVLNDMGKRGDAEAADLAALKIKAQLAAGFPRVPEYRQGLARAHNHLGTQLTSLGKHSEAEAPYRAALKIREQLAADFPSVAELREDLATSHNNLSVLLNDHLGRRGEAEAACRSALKIREQLAADFPSVPQYRQGLARSSNNLGNLLWYLGQREEAEVAYRAAQKIREQLAVDFPTRPDLRLELARSHTSLGRLLASMGKLEDAEAACRAGLKISEQLAADFPNVPDYAMVLGASYSDLGHLLTDKREPQPALEWCAKAIGALYPVLQQEPRLVNARQSLCDAHRNRAVALDMLERHGEAVQDWDRAIELGGGNPREDLRPNLAVSRLRGSRMHKDAAGCLAAAAEYEVLTRTDAGGLYGAACNRAICAAVIREDQETSEVDAPWLTKEQADLAMGFVHRAVAAGFKDATHMKEDKDLASLREREDFKELLAELEAKNK
jgi:serine/threonine protein kinase